jgi:hypothetical protein
MTASVIRYTRTLTASFYPTLRENSPLHLLLFGLYFIRLAANKYSFFPLPVKCLQLFLISVSHLSRQISFLQHILQLYLAFPCFIRPGQSHFFNYVLHFLVFPSKPLSYLQHFLKLYLTFPCFIHPSHSHFCNTFNNYVLHFLMSSIQSTLIPATGLWDLIPINLYFRLI